MDDSTAAGHVLLLPTLPSSTASTRQPWHPYWQPTGTTITLSGYQLVTDRHSILPVIIVLTGETTDQIEVDEYSFAAASSLTPDEQHQAWSDLRAVFKASNARITQARDSSGHLPLTALPSLDPSLSVVQLPGGNYRKAAPLLYTNINLRRLGLGGRSALRLTAPTGAQQLNFRQTYKLQAPARNSSNSDHNSFETTVLDFVQLVQHALSLFGLGPVVHHASDTTVPSTVHGIHTSNPLARQVLDALNTSLSEPLELQKPLLDDGDGLLCDITLGALAVFKEEFAGPILHVPAVDQSAMSSAVLSSLLSLVIGTKAKMLALGASGVPRDPFSRREKFLRSVRAFQHMYRISPVASVLTRSFLLALGKTYSRSRGEVGGGAKAKVSRALRGKLDAGLSTLGAAATSVTSSASTSGALKDDDFANSSLTATTGISSKTLGASRQNGAGDDATETSNLETFLNEVAKGGAGRTVARLWGLRESRRDRREDERDTEGIREGLKLRRKRNNESGRDQDTDGEGTEPGATTSEGESTVHGFGRNVFKGVKQRAGRAGRLLGDNLGWDMKLFSVFASPMLIDLNKLAPSITISSDKSNSRHTSIDVDSHPSRSGSLATRLASALTADAGLTASVRHRLSPSPNHRSRFSSLDANDDSEVCDAPRVTLPRRVVSDMPGDLPTLATLGSAIDLDEKVTDRERFRLKSTAGYVKLERRHTFNILQDAPEPSQVLSRKRLVLDVNLRSTYHKLRFREQDLADMVSALQTIRDSFDKAIASIEPLVNKKAQTLLVLSDSASSLTTRAETYSQPQSTVSKLSIGTSRLSYAQSVVDEKLVDVVDFDKLLRSKVGPGGTIDKGVRGVSKTESGLRSFVSSFEYWKAWFGWG
ncbi:hypothetical protein OIV83_003907 [Microbotryomycetes sp. JL201]|nr:hypothetical protein OIV83_003907 [Microbotryomycetes sp. JL201]